MRDTRRNLSRSPLNNNRLADAIFLYVKVKGSVSRIKLKDILYIQGLSDYIIVYTAQQRLVMHCTMKALLSGLPEQDFMRVHKSYIVRLDKIEVIEANKAYIKDTVVPISRSHKNDILRKFKVWNKEALAKKR